MDGRKLRRDEAALYALSSLYEQAGYIKYKMRKFEEYELYAENRSFLQSGHFITFTDLSGKLLALKPDVTLSIAKNSADTVTQKVYYNENVYRECRQTREYTEITQIGLELIGELDLYNVCEVLDLASRSLSRLSDRYIIEISHMGYLSGLLDTLELSAAQKSQLLKCAGRRAEHELRALGSRYGLSPRSISTLAGCASLYGAFGPTLLRAGQLAENEAMREAVAQLSDIYGILGDDSSLTLDLSITNDEGYYNNIIFRGYIDGVPGAVLSGGEYDRLMEKLGKKSQAAGFAVYLGELEKHLRDDSKYDVDILLLYSSTDDAGEVLREARRLRKEGKSVRVQKSDDTAVRYREKITFGGCDE